jgi:hypothetical protein
MQRQCTPEAGKREQSLGRMQRRKSWPTPKQDCLLQVQFSSIASQASC